MAHMETGNLVVGIEDVYCHVDRQTGIFGGLCGYFSIGQGNLYGKKLVSFAL